MRRVRAWAAIPAWISATLLLSACASDVTTAPAVTAPPTPAPVALMEHARYESGYRPCAAGPAGLRYTFQWGGGRLQRLHEFAGTRRCPPLARQLAFADDELRNDPKFSCFLRTTTKASALAALRRGFGAGSC